MASERVQRRIERLLDQIEDAADQLNWVEVQERANALLAYDPENQDALTFLAVAERALTARSGSPSTSPAASAGFSPELVSHR